MDPLSAKASEHSVSPKQPGPQNTGYMMLPESEASAVGIDRKTKKRIQNRVAQRTYRTRIKQRLHDLQHQVQTLQQKEEEQQRENSQEAKVEYNRADEIPFFSQFTTNLATKATGDRLKDQPNLGASCQDIPGIKTTDSSAWSSISSQPDMWNSPFGGISPMHDNTLNVPSRPPTATMQGLLPTSLPLDPPGGILYSHTCRGEHQRNIPAYAGGAEENPLRHIRNRTNNIFVDGEGHPNHFQNLDSTQLSPWIRKLELRPTTSGPVPVTAAGHPANVPQSNSYQDGTMNPPITTAPAQWPEIFLPNSQATVEEQFEYVLHCAQRVGFDSFDTMALQYYTRNFNPTSPLALEQHFSRNRRLPELLAELRKQSATWNMWERRGYQDETLKAAQEICTAEYGEFRMGEVNSNDEDIPNAAALGQMVITQSLGPPDRLGVKQPSFISKANFGGGIYHYEASVRVGGVTKSINRVFRTIA
ncbi:hypothetical protein NUW58_g5943 [Xylaria curta]|uniref:Uncharacterized protein n=1 Tax=Xylaria curta TaxID=42375 RepID=A0ACC1P0N5_9PEZI|nr:hypothetical protein NUW58_g5943 [Xylaria curta]